MAYIFEPEEATVLIRILPNHYVRINEELIAPQKSVELNDQGNKVIVWDKKSAEVWVSQKVARELTTSGENFKGNEGESRQVQPIAEFVETRDKPKTVTIKTTKTTETKDTTVGMKPTV